jgi:hypothetical protein
MGTLRWGKAQTAWFGALAAFAVLAGLVGRWGRPVPSDFSVSPEDVYRGTWRIERRASSPEIWTARSLDGSGVMDEFDTPTGRFFRPDRAHPPKRWLIICLDGVPLRLMDQLWNEGRFREFYRPSAVTSVFPSDSEAALTAALHTRPVPGYEPFYFDTQRNELRGGAWITLTGAHIPYIRALDYDPPGWAKALPYLAPQRTYDADLERFRERFLASRKKIFFAHISSSDSLCHMEPPEKLVPPLVEFERVVRDLYLENHGQLGILVFSDHGDTLTPSRGVPLESFLRERGWHPSQRLQRSRDVVAPAYGLIGFIAVYGRPGETNRLASDLAQLEGVELVIERSNELNAATIRGSDGTRAVLRWTQDGNRYNYEPLRGDPLALAPVFARLREQGRLAPDGSASDADLFLETALAPYPDAAARIRDWATDHVENRAPIAVSLRPGSFYGKSAFQRIMHFSFAGTHGALDAASSLGFAMRTEPLPPALRLGNVIPPELRAEHSER